MYGVSKCAASHTCKVYRESYGLYVVHGILLNHESERRQEYFVTRKITKAVAKISKAIQNNEDFAVLELGNLDSKRDWSYAPDFVDGIWRMLNQEKYRKELSNIDKNDLSKHIKEYVLASGECHSIKEFVELAFSIALPNYEFKWILNDNFVTANDSKLLVRVNPAFYRPADVLTLCGNSSLAREELGWCPKVKFKELVKIMVDYDLNQ
jgi:GDPmannose 4,6-dehydratase